MRGWAFTFHDLLLAVCLIGAWAVIAGNAVLALAGRGSRTR